MVESAEAGVKAPCLNRGMVDYTIFYRCTLPTNTVWSSEEDWDLFISAYVPTDRAERVFQRARAGQKWWLVFPEYRYESSQYPDSSCFNEPATDEASFITNFWHQLPDNVVHPRICIDITGFIRPYLIFLVRWLQHQGIRKFDAIYAEPSQYIGQELTEFSDVIREVRQVAGFEGTHSPDITHDVLIIGAGYEDNLISHVAENKAKASKIRLIGFPSLRADMYQENLLCVKRAEESLGGTVDDELHTRFAPANDPFVAATILSQIVKELKAKDALTNLYLCPLSTRAHVLGFTLFYLTECQNTPTSIIFPFEETYSKSTSHGVGRIWKYTVELPALDS